MLRSLTLLLTFLAAAHAAILPDQFLGAARSSVKQAVIADRAVWEEYGLEEAETAVYGVAPQTFSVTAIRLKDPTGALAAFQWQRRAGSAASEIGEHAAEEASGVFLQFGNYVLRIEGRKPAVVELAPLLHALPQLDQSPLPLLPGYLPTQGRVANSERYVLGPASLEKFESRIPPSVAGFHFGVEAQLGTFDSAGGQMQLAIFSYPTPHIARERVEAFQALPDAMAKRAGPLVAVILAPPNADAAEQLLSLVRYKASLSWSEYIPSRRDNIGDLILNIFILTGVLLLFALVSGLAFGGLRVLIRRVWSKGQAPDPMIMLHLEDRT